MSEKEREKKSLLPIEPPNPLEIVDQITSVMEEAETSINDFDSRIREMDLKLSGMDRKFSVPKVPLTQKTTVKETIPASGRTFQGQTDEAYCLECLEGHTMTALTEMRHALDRYRASGEMTSGVAEKVRVALAELMGITEDVKNTKDASPEVKKGLDEILNEVRWIRKEYGVSGRGLTRGIGSTKDLEELRDRIETINKKSYEIADLTKGKFSSKCSVCKKIAEKVSGKIPDQTDRTNVYEAIYNLSYGDKRSKNEAVITLEKHGLLQEVADEIKLNLEKMKG